MRAEISFIDPADLFDLAAAEELGVGFLLSAIIHLLDEDDVPLPEEAGRFVHVGLPRDYGTELRNCWWLNTTPDSDFERMTTDRFRHVHEEFGYLESFLPARYAAAQ